jgi:hypothetical protein
MPYLRCQRCGATTFSAARWSSIDGREVCGSDLRRGAEAPPGKPGEDVEGPVRRRLHGSRQPARR